MLFAIAALILGQDSQHYVTVPYKRNDPHIIIEATVGGKKEQVVLDSGFPLSRVPESQGQISVPVSIGQMDMTKIPFAPDESVVPPIDATLGYQVLDHFSIGIDMIACTATFWGGDLGEKGADEWLAQAPAWPGQKLGKPIVTDIAVSKDYDIPYVTLTRGTRKYNLAVSMLFDGAVVSGLPDSFSNTPGPVHFEAGATLDQTPLPWFQVANMYDGKNPYDDAGLNGVFSIENLWSRRIVFDFPGHKIYSEGLSQEGQATMLLLRLTRSPVELRDGAMVVGGPWLTQALQGYRGQKVIDINGTPASQICQDLLHPTEASATELTALVDKWMAGEVDCRFLLPSGQPYTIYSAAPPK